MATDQAARELGLMVDYLVLKLSGLIDVTADMKSALTMVCTTRATFARGDHVIQPGETFKSVYLIMDGWATRSKLTSSGARQIINFAIPGDFLCFNAALFRESEVFVRAHTRLEAFVVPIRPFSEMLLKQPQLAIALAWTAAQEEGIVSERLLSLGRRSALQRSAHLLCEIHKRLQTVRLVKETDQFELPMTQEDLADALGVSLIHMNRVLRNLSKTGLISIKRSSVRLLDLKALRSLAGFDDDYLHLPEHAA
ncbi:MAG: Crp/Fnr family transcriptional regulator [Alphaproteobacteria bacterium]|nr:Crp/Fnr family transcriptional regulator [Alphaproteobacteria bacterium]